jgi:hypothetical protein
MFGKENKIIKRERLEHKIDSLWFLFGKYIGIGSLSYK